MHDLLRAIYDRSPALLQNLGVSGYGFLLHQRRYGGTCHRLFRDLLTTQWFGESEMASLVDEKVRMIVALAARESPYYRERLRTMNIAPESIGGARDLVRLPFLEKEDLRREGPRILTHWPRGEGLYLSSTSGTSGKPLTLYTNRTTERSNYAFFRRLQDWMGVRMGEPRATFYGRTIVPGERDRPPFWRYDLSENNWQFSSYHLSPDHLNAYIEKLARVRPTEIRGYPSSVVQVARALVRRRDLQVKPRAIQTTAETLLPHWREEIQGAFSCPVFDQYGSSEMSHYVSQCEKGTYHVHPEYGVVEILVDGRPARPGEEGEVVCTSFVNLAMPLVRYRLGDLAVPGSGRCPCGRAFPTLERVTGRVDDVLVTPDGRAVGRLDPVFKGAGRILEAQVVQTAPDAVTLKLVPSDGFSPEVQGSVVGELQRRLGPLVVVTVEILSAIPKEPNGKFRTVVRRLQP